jgi:hypothetical protein
VTNEDFDQLQRLAPHLKELPNVGVLSPIHTGEDKLFPKATALPRWRWDLNKPGNRRFDLLVAANVFMYGRDPALWFRHVLAGCRYLLLLDLIRRRRSEGNEFGTDGDCSRYAVGGEHPRVEHHFDLNTLGDRLLGYRTFNGGANAFDDEPLHVVALIRGDLADPILRIDDYPTGVRPIATDLSPLHEVLHKVEDHGLRYHLGIVPALLADAMYRFLQGLEHVIPAVHGYDHSYPKYAPLLRAKGDPFNERTVGVFNEFRGQPYGVILDKLKEGRRLLQDGLGKPVKAYIPPCNIGDRRTGRALVEAGYDYYLSEKRIPGCPLPWVRSDFYGRSSEFDDRRRPDIVTLHTTWEADIVRQGGGPTLDRLLDQLRDRKQVERERGARLGAIVGQTNESR